MKKLIIILTLSVGIIGCSKSSENKSFEKKLMINRRFPIFLKIMYKIRIAIRTMKQA